MRRKGARFRHTTLGERVEGKYIQNEQDECWPWLGYINKAGYGQIDMRHRDGKRYTTTAHRAIYMLLVGDIPEGHQLDHLCHTTACKEVLMSCPHRRCVNPKHMAPVTPAENDKRRNRFSGFDTHCLRGHEFTELNTRWHNGWRACRQCIRDTRWLAKNPGGNLQAHERRGSYKTAHNPEGLPYVETQ